MFRVFRTSVQNQFQVEKIKPFLPQQQIADWSFDLDDADKIFRIRADFHIAELEKLFQENGFICEELTDD